MREADRQDRLTTWRCGPVQIHDWLRNAEIREINSLSRGESEDSLKCLGPLEARRELGFFGIPYRDLIPIWCVDN